MNIRDRLVDDINCWWKWATTWLNLIGSSIITWALSHEGVVTTLIPFMPGPWKPYAPILGIAWGLIIQVGRSIRQKKPGAAG